MIAKRPVILVTIGWPDDEAAGPIHSIKTLSERLADEFEMKIIARERPYGVADGTPKPKGWVRSGRAQIYWCRMSRLGPAGFRTLLRTTPHDVLLLNGFFDHEFTIPALVLRRLGLIPGRPTLLSPRGEFGEGALGLKPARKRAYVALARRLGLLSDVILHATGPSELEDIRRTFPWSRGTLLAPNVRQLPDPPVQSETSHADGTRLVFLGRIARVKNLHFGLQVLGSVRVRLAFDIYGPISEPEYWRECERIIAALPGNIAVSYRGEIPNRAVPATFAGYDLFFLPTLGENFGHAIFEALANGVPALISDTTPWRELKARGAGWSLPLDQPLQFAAAIEKFAAMSPDQRRRLRNGARRAAEQMVASSDAIVRNREMFRTLIGMRADAKRPHLCGTEVAS
jgi:glycosyltransferase involved in cell wall biosynthesis